jgi:hypothetical protein
MAWTGAAFGFTVPPVQRIRQLMLVREVIAVYSENDRKPKNALFLVKCEVLEC